MTSLGESADFVFPIGHFIAGTGQGVSSNYRFPVYQPSTGDGLCILPSGSREARDAAAPFGGNKASGFGREVGSEGPLDFTSTKTVYIRPIPASAGRP